MGLAVLDYGTEVWIDTYKTIGTKGTRKIKVTMSCVTVLVRHARLIVLIIHTEICTMVVASGHVPLDDGDEWWKMLFQALPHGRKVSYPVM